jgi:hypothetical protein
MDRGGSTFRPAALTAIYLGDEIPGVPGLLACARNCAKLHSYFMLPIQPVARSELRAAPVVENPSAMEQDWRNRSNADQPSRGHQWKAIPMLACDEEFEAMGTS